MNEELSRREVLGALSGVLGPVKAIDNVVLGYGGGTALEGPRPSPHSVGTTNRARRLWLSGCVIAGEGLFVRTTAGTANGVHRSV